MLNAVICLLRSMREKSVLSGASIETRSRDGLSSPSLSSAMLSFMYWKAAFSTSRSLTLPPAALAFSQSQYHLHDCKREADQISPNDDSLRIPGWRATINNPKGG